MDIREVPTSSLKPWPENPRAIDNGALKRLKKQLTTHGLFKPLLVTPDLTVIGGNMRLRALTELGIDTVTVAVVHTDNKSETIAIAIADNDRAGYYVESQLIDLIRSAGELDLSDYSIDLGKAITLEALMDRVKDDKVEEDEAPSVEETEEVVSLGDVWTLGDHRLICGSATSEEDISLLMDGKKADLIFTDPPYNVAYTGKTKDALTIKNDSMTADQFYTFLYDSFKTMADHSKLGASIYICHADSEGMNFRKAMQDAGFLLKQTIVWKKNTIVLGRQDYQWQHEPILYGWKDGGSHNFYGDRKQTTVWEIDKPSRNAEHPTMKPIELCAKAICNSSKSGDIVTDYFGGSGSTLIACEQTGRVCYTSELDPKYASVIVKRWENLTGNKALKVHSVQSNV
jgi:DNA modification methylase